MKSAYDYGSDDDYFDGVDLRNMDPDDLQVLSPRRKFLVELELALDIEIPATKKVHKGKNWKKSSPNIANEDLKAILVGVLKKQNRPPEVARSLAPEVLQLTPQEREVYRCFLEVGQEEYLTPQDIAEKIGSEPNNVRVYLGRLQDKVAFHVDDSGRRNRYRLPPGFREKGVAQHLG